MVMFVDCTSSCAYWRGTGKSHEAGVPGLFRRRVAVPSRTWSS